MTDRRTPLARVLGSGSAKGGTGHWWSQRITAIALMLLGGWFLLSVAQLPGLEYDVVRAWLAAPWRAVLMLLLILTVAYHSDLGVQVIIEDYVHHPLLKVLSILVVRSLHILLAAASILALLRIAYSTGS